MGQIDASYVTMLYEHLEARGLDAATILGRAPAPGQRFSADSWKELLSKGQAATGESAFGLRVAHRFSFRHLGVLGYLALSCNSVMDAVQQGKRYQKLISDQNPTEFRQAGDQLEISWPLKAGWNGQLWDEMCVGGSLQMARSIFGNQVKATRADFVCAAPQDGSFYRDFFGGEVWFDQPEPRLVLPANILELPLPSADPDLKALLDAQAEQKLRQLAPLNEDLHRLRQRLLQLIRQGQTHIEHLAADQGVGVRALQRRLSALDSNFQDLLDDTRRVLAEQFLADPRLDLHEVAALLGYTEQSSFTRAFTKWNGCPPGKWRSNQGRNSEDPISAEG